MIYFQANAPHIPVHLGAMQEAGKILNKSISLYKKMISYTFHILKVKFQIEYAKACPLKNGDVILSNHPACGGSHLPDLTVITPVFHEDSIVFVN
jgi:5-oxoprolinase (ATP-hydrolysing)